MALNTEIDSLDAGAPELRLEGEQQAGGPYNTGSDVKNALAVWNNMGPQDRAEFDGFLDFFRTGAWRDQIQGMRQMQQQRSTAAQGGRMGYATGYAVAAPGQGGTGDPADLLAYFEEKYRGPATERLTNVAPMEEKNLAAGALEAYQSGQDIIAAPEASSLSAVSTPEVTQAAPQYDQGTTEFLQRNPIPTSEPDWYPNTGMAQLGEDWNTLSDADKANLMREEGDMAGANFVYPEGPVPPAGMMPPVGPVPLTDPSMMAGQFDPSMITTPRDNQYNVAQWNKEEMLRKGVDPRMFASYGGTARPTYTQSRKQRINAAGGGIMGSNAGSMLVAPTADGSRPGYGIWDKITKPFKKVATKIKEDIIPNEIKAIAASPIGKAALLTAGSMMIPGIGGAIQSGVGALGKGIMGIPVGSTTLGQLPVLKQLGQVGTSALTGLGNIRTGATNLINRIPGIDIPGGTEYSTTRPSGMDVGYGITGKQGVWSGTDDIFSQVPMTDSEAAAAMKRLAGLDKQNWFNQYITDPIKKAVTGGTDQDVNWQTPLAIGTAMGAAQAAMPKDVIPVDKTGYPGGIGAIQRTARITPEALAAAKGLHFVPQDAARLRSPAEEQAILGAAEGGRIGYGNGGIYEKALTDAWKTYKEQGGTLSLEKFAEQYMK